MSIIDKYIQLIQSKESTTQDKMLSTESKIIGETHLQEESKKIKEESEAQNDLATDQVKLASILVSLKIEKENFNYQDYFKLLKISKLAYANENNGIPEEHAAKLVYAFGSYDAAIQYLKRYEKENPNQQHMIHDACLFSIPTEKCDIKLWQELSQIHMPNVSFERILPFASKIENYVHNPDNPKEFRSDLKENIQAELLRKQEERLGNEFDELEKKRGARLKEIPSLEEFINLKMQDKKVAKEIDAAIDKVFSNLFFQKGILPSGIDKKKIGEELKKYKNTEAGKKDWEKIQAQIITDKKNKLEKEYNTLYPSDDQFKEAVWEKDFVKNLSPLPEDEKQKKEYIEGKLQNERKHRYITQRKQDEATIFEQNCTDAYKRILSKDTSLEKLEFYYKHTCFKRANENPQAAALFLEYGLTENQFNQYLSLMPSSSSNIPNIFIDGEEIGYPGFYIEKLKSTDPKCAILGKLTSCCQSLDSAGSACAIHGITSTNGGFYVLRQKKYPKADPNDPIVAQSWAWLKDNNLVLDSIESQMDFRRKNVVIISDFFIYLANKLVTEHKIEKVNVGQGATPSSLSILNSDSISPGHYSGYRDSHQQFTLANSQAPTLQYYVAFQHYLTNTAKVSNFKKKFDINLKDILKLKDNITFKDLSAKYKKTYLGLERFIKKEIDGELSNPLWLHSAVGKDSFLVTKFLILNNRDVNTQDNNGNTPLHIAVSKDNSDIIQLLIHYGANINLQNKNGETPLHISVSQKDFETIKLLIQNGANINLQDKDGNTPLHLAIQDIRLVIRLVELLLESKDTIDPFMKNNKGERIFDHVSGLINGLGFSYNKDKEDLIKKFTNCMGNNLLATDENKRTVLHYAAESEMFLFVDEILNIGKKSADMPDKDGCLPLHLAIKAGALDAADKLLKHTSNLNQQDNGGETVLHYAVRSRSKEFLQKLITKGIDVNLKNSKGKTALQTGIDLLLEKTELPFGMSGWMIYDTLKLLLEQGANVDKEDHDKLAQLGIKLPEKTMVLAYDKTKSVNSIDQPSGFEKPKFH